MGDKHNKGKAAGDFKSKKGPSDYKLQQMGGHHAPVNPNDNIGMNPRHKR